MSAFLYKSFNIGEFGEVCLAAKNELLSEIRAEIFPRKKLSRKRATSAEKVMICARNKLEYFC
jgi:hypothetical protein